MDQAGLELPIVVKDVLEFLPPPLRGFATMSGFM